MDVSSCTLVLHAVDSYSDDALCIVFKAGANPDPKVLKRLFYSSLLTAASFSGLVNMAKLFINSSAKVDAYNLEGYLLLTRAIMYNNYAVLKLLIKWCRLDGL